ncbi:MAG: MiaB/RimO family radical SAM methylthiotransferase [Deltaproteobacteria bacterium]|nr:MiaB/RimO family radical SAM methylthiotransferase [Deltaproteobacteria bacterium]
MGFRVAIFTVGCRANQADSDRLARSLDPRFVELTDGRGSFDIAVINTCCVTAQAERDCRKLVRRALRASPAASVIVTGCAVSAIEGFVDNLGTEVEALGGGDDDPAILAAVISERAAQTVGSPSAGERPSVWAAARTRPLLKVQNGCTHDCAYCVVPAARGPERSEPLTTVIERAEQLASEGFVEIVLTGVQLGAWGRDLPGRPRLAELVRTVADRFAPGRVRLSSIEPWSVDDELLELIIGHERVCAHLHIPLQSGDDRVLETMGRGYRAVEVLDLVERARNLDADLALGTDVICGFPGEDRASFESTLKVLEQLEPSYLHAFSFSARPGTRAARLPGALDHREIKRRVSEVIALGEASTRRFQARLVGQVREVVVESRRGAEPRGLTDNYVSVALKDDAARVGDLVWVELGIGAGTGLRQVGVLRYEDHPKSRSEYQA